MCVFALCAGNPEDTAARATASEKDGDIKRVSTKEWARSTGYDAVKLFNKVPVRQVKLVGLFQNVKCRPFMCMGYPNLLFTLQGATVCNWL